MIRARSLIAVSFLLLGGAGCSLYAPTPSTPSVAEPLSGDASAHVIAQEKGFGTLPTLPAPILRPATHGTVRLDTTISPWPTRISVLRVKSGELANTPLNQLAGALHIPPALMTETPQRTHLTLDWTDTRGYRWSYDAAARRFTFTSTKTPRGALTVSAWPDMRRITENGLAFFTQFGISLEKFSAPYIAPDWNGWWKQQYASQHCMSAATVATIRALAASTALLETAPPTLPLQKETACVTPELPGKIMLHFDARQDSQAVLTAEGKPVQAATLVLDATSLEVQSGTFTLPLNPDRSDYPARSLNDVRDAMLRGGLGGTPNGDVVLNSFSLEWFKLDTNDTPPTTYLYPTLVGRGTITYSDKTTAPTSIIVPLVSE